FAQSAAASASTCSGGPTRLGRRRDAAKAGDDLPRRLRPSAVGQGATGSADFLTIPTVFSAFGRRGADSADFERIRLGGSRIGWEAAEPAGRQPNRLERSGLRWKAAESAGRQPNREERGGLRWKTAEPAGVDFARRLTEAVQVDSNPWHGESWE
ncbi:MAG: hypothetical protein ACYC6M_15785, partial [Terriglobales bacterium]